MRFIQRYAIPILSTIILHLLIFIVIFSYKIRQETIIQPESYVEIQPITPPEEQRQNKPNDDKTQSEINRMLRESGSAKSNVAVNSADKLEKDVSTEEYLKQLRNNYNFDMPGEKSASKEKIEENDDNNTPATQVAAQTKPKPGYKKGMTNIEYYLPNRKDLRLPVPVYKCEGSGLVTVKIEVSQQGRVVSCAVDRKNSDASECFVEEALKSARSSMFNGDYQKAPARQSGTITYRFIAQ
jgi:hypothetical protein